ncbi:MAG: hypothetical protein HY899_18050 [Deltaproteobacteria bacterium]|nr:hypothetical protein [Deltaproteobacteria bacterium]
MNDAFELASAPRWSGAPGRVEVWYATLTNPATGVGLWVHNEIVAPTAERDAEPYGHGWISLFPTGSAPITARFGPGPVRPSAAGAPWFEVNGCRAQRGLLGGSANGIAWDLRWIEHGGPLWTFPQALWSRELLPGAQVLPAPVASFTGTVSVGDTTYSFDGATGGVAHIYAHGNAERWGWVHADLGGGDVLELVSAVSRKPGMNRLPPLAFLRFRVDGRDWPAGLLPALRTRTRLALPYWSVEGRVGQRRIRVRVGQPPDRCVALKYVDPDGQACVCTNTERADIWVDVEKRAGSGWKIERAWHLDGTGHAEVGLRGRQAPPVRERRRR